MKFDELCGLINHLSAILSFQEASTQFERIIFGLSTAKQPLLFA